MLASSSGFGTYLDQYLPTDVAETRTDNHRDGAYSFSGTRQAGQIGDYCFEIAFPLDSGDAQDAHVFVGKAFGFEVSFTHWDQKRRVRPRLLGD